MPKNGIMYESIVRGKPSPPTEKIFHITDSNIRELCEIEVLDFNKKPAELALVPLL